ncbi:nucleolar MIF4G domain-containing protein 1 [Oncorhynchus kisutch]|uniref:nucleolar MIF4G domain-containing protein 1 n=1 Tax=Oncorhynchus kisutch TaxID=8019 RepID=UPI00099FA6BA|nr:nucleolar MIF4G domain-containing protein 1 [Oncorhynchus kisutch]
MIGDQGNMTSKQTTAEGKFSLKILDLAWKRRMNRHKEKYLLRHHNQRGLPGCLLRSWISGIPKLGMLWEGLKLFISHFLLKIAQPQGPAEQTGLLSEQAEVTPEAKETKLKL